MGIKESAIKSCEARIKHLQNVPPHYHGKRQRMREIELEKVKIAALTPPNEWVSVYDRLPEPGERVLATDCGFVGEFYINKRGKWQRYNVNCSELLMALDILYWMPLPAPPDKDNHVPAKAPNEPLTLEQLREMDGEPVWFDTIKRWGIVKVNREGIFVVTKSGEYEFGRCKVYRRPPEGEEET